MHAKDITNANDYIVTLTEKYDRQTGRFVDQKLSDLERYGDWRNDPQHGTCVVPALLCGGDYSGTLVQRANHDAWERDFTEGENVWWVSVIGGHGTFAIVIDASAIPEDKETDVKEWLGNLADYPLADEDLHSELEMKAQSEAWATFTRNGFLRALAKAHDLEDESAEDDASNNAVFELFRELCERSNTDWVNEQGDQMYIDIDRIVAKSTEDEARALLNPGQAPDAKGTH